jgi:hypothetical protein
VGAMVDINRTLPWISHVYVVLGKMVKGNFEVIGTGPRPWAALAFDPHFIMSL